LITQNNPSGSPEIGELWVSYCVEFFKPVLAQENNASLANGLRLSRTGVTSSKPFGDTTVTSQGTLTFTPAIDKITVSNAVIGTKYMWTISWYAGTSVNIAAFTTSGMSALNIFNSNSVDRFTAGPTTTIQTIEVSGTATSSTMVIQVTSSTVNGTCSVDAILSVLDNFIG
jgi:hypothetical protein